MVRAAVLASGDGGRLQAILDAIYFKEIPNSELVAVICPERGCNAMKRALNAKVPAYVVGPELFPTMTSHSMAVANKLRDMDIELVTGATAYFADGDGRVGGIILQKAVEVRPGDDPETLGRRVMEECEWPLLTRAVAAYCGGELQVRGNRVRFQAPVEN